MTERREKQKTTTSSEMRYCEWDGYRMVSSSGIIQSQSIARPPATGFARPMPRSASRLSHLSARLSFLRYGSSISKQRRLWSYDHGTIFEFVNSKLPPGWRTLSHCFSLPDNMESLTIFVWIGTQVRRSNPYQGCPPHSCLVCNKDLSKDDIFMNRKWLTLISVTTSADSILMPNSFSLSGLHVSENRFFVLKSTPYSIQAHW